MIIKNTTSEVILYEKIIGRRSGRNSLGVKYMCLTTESGFLVYFWNPLEDDDEAPEWKNLADRAGAYHIGDMLFVSGKPDKGDRTIIFALYFKKRGVIATKGRQYMVIDADSRSVICNSPGVWERRTVANIVVKKKPLIVCTRIYIPDDVLCSERITGKKTLLLTVREARCQMDKAILTRNYVATKVISMTDCK